MVLGGRLRAAIPTRQLTGRPADRPTDRPTEVVNERSRWRRIEGDALNPKSNSVESGRAQER